MFAKLLTVTALSLGLGSAAMAQTPTSGSSFQPPGDWNATVAGALFSDVTTGAVRSADEIKSNFAALNAQDQASIREYCKRFDTSATGGGTVATGNAPGTSANNADEAVREACATAGKL